MMSCLRKKEYVERLVWFLLQTDEYACLFTTGISGSSTIDTGEGSWHPLCGWWIGTVRKQTKINIGFLKCAL